MALTRDFKATVVSRVKSDPAFAQALLDEALTLLLNGDPEVTSRQCSGGCFAGYCLKGMEK